MQHHKKALVATIDFQGLDPDTPLAIKSDAARYANGAVPEQQGKPAASESGKTEEREKLLRR